MSIMSMAATGIYSLVVLACLMAALASRGFKDRPGDPMNWLLSAAIFAGLAAMRIWKGEDAIRNLAREYTRSSGDYVDRFWVQAPLAILAIAAGFGVIWLFAHKWQNTRLASRAQLVLIAQFGLVSLLPLYGLRLLSWHASDRLLYSGPLRLNWLLDGFICLLVGGSALLYALKKRRRLNPDRARSDMR